MAVDQQGLSSTAGEKYNLVELFWEIVYFGITILYYLVMLNVLI